MPFIGSGSGCSNFRRLMDRRIPALQGQPNAPTAERSLAKPTAPQTALAGAYKRTQNGLNAGYRARPTPHGGKERGSPAERIPDQRQTGITKDHGRKIKRSPRSIASIHPSVVSSSDFPVQIRYPRNQDEGERHGKLQVPIV